MAILSSIIYFVITILVIVMIHELGHFFAAKLCGMRVDRFSIGFPPRLFGKKFGDTDYCISLLPIGGYVKIAGMIDESMDTDFLAKEPQPWEFRSKSVPKKIFVIVAGVVMNLLLSVMIFWGIKYFQTEIIWKTTEIGTVKTESIAGVNGFRTNDKIISINGKQVDNWNQLENQIIIAQISDNVNVSIEREGQKVDLTIPKNSVKETDNSFLFFPKYVKVKILSVQSGSPADKAGIIKDDIIKSINGIPISVTTDAVKIIQENAGKEVPLTLQRTDGKIIETRVIPDAKTKIIGIGLSTFYFGPKDEKHLGIFESFGGGIKLAVNTTFMFFKSIWFIIEGKVEFSKAIGGPVKIAELASQSADLGIINFLSFIGMLSLTLGIINILPFPVLDGGHLMFLIYEGIFKKEFPVKARLIMQQAGFYLLMIFMLFVIYNDIFR